MSWGEQLRSRREELGYSLQTAEEETKIRRLYLEALENDNFSILPAKVYSIGFVKNYAKFLHLDEKQVSEQFRELVYGNENIEEEIVTYTSKPLLPQWLTAANALAALIFLIVVIWTGNYLVGYFAGRNIIEPPVTPPVVQSPGPGNEEEPDDSVTVPDKVNLAVSARQDCWLEVTVDGVDNYFGFIRAGEAMDFTGEQSVNIRAGNAGGIDIVFNEEEIGAFGDIGQVKEQEFTI